MSSDLQPAIGPAHSARSFCRQLAIILNIKGVAIKKKVKEPIKITLDIKGPKVLTAGDLELDTDIEVTNKDHYIATLNEDAQLYMELEIVSGKGYKISDLNKDEFDEIGVISIDSSFTPVRKVNYKVENTRVGQITDYDKIFIFSQLFNVCCFNAFILGLCESRLMLSAGCPCSLPSAPDR